MGMNINIEKFMKYFFFGLENKQEIVKLIILDIAKNVTHEQKSLYDDRNEPITFYELEKNMVKNLIVQLERFTTLHDISNDNYFYDSIQIDSEEIEDLYNTNLNELKNQWAVVPCTYRPCSALYFTDRVSKENTIEKDGKKTTYYFERYTGEERLQMIHPFAKEVYTVLKYLQELEQKSKIEYYSLFLDCKYARAIDRRLKEQTTDDNELVKIEETYKLFLKRKTSICNRYCIKIRKTDR